MNKFGCARGTIHSIAQAELEPWTATRAAARQEHAQLIGWAELYDNCTFAAKKMIVAQFVKAIYVGRNDELDILCNVSFEDFQRLYMEGEDKKASSADILQPTG